MILCLESSADPTVIGLARGEELIAERVLADRDRLAAEIVAVLGASRVKAKGLQAVAIGIGPGSFTGLRVSLSFAKGLARGAEIPIWPVCSLKILAANARGIDRPVVVISPARRGEVHCVTFDAHKLEVLGERRVLPLHELANETPSQALLIGPGVAKLDEKIRAALGARIATDPEWHRPHAAVLARLAREAWEGRTPPDISSLVPEYGLEFPSGALAP